SLTTLAALYHFREHCTGKLESAPATAREFEQALCNKTPLPEAWFAAHPIHPLGGSYASHYLLRHPEDSVALQRFLHVRERPDELAGLGRLSDDNLDAIATGQHSFLQSDGAQQMLWWQSAGIWQRYAPDVWQPLAQQAALELRVPGGSCELALGNICVNAITPYRDWWRWVVAFSACLVLLSLAYVLWQRRRLHHHQKFILQMLIHELRTPITNLGNVVEAFRYDFDRLPDSAQMGFGRLADGVQRMRQLADASRHYLSVDSADGILEASSSIQLSVWLEMLMERHEGVQFCLDQDHVVALPFYWLTLCLDNVLNNACRYGKAPVRLCFNLHHGKLILIITDAGVLPQYDLVLIARIAQKRDLISSASPMSGEGMGLGLSIVRRVMKRLKGKISLSGPPTTFTLELPCELSNES
ncbi:MAG: DUF3404 domain-containing protein, partial [Glaciimonas sp.]|nr:DUF3404 domain-containing protein [Glaciimonas sp.]